MTSKDSITVDLGTKLKDRVVDHNYKFRKDKNKKINMSDVCRKAIENELEIKGAV